MSLPTSPDRRRAGIGSHTTPSSGATDVWLTPPWLLDALGPFDLDPCAAPEPRPWPTATRHITLPDDGLTVPWSGRVWCNPPYGDQTWRWLHRLADHGHGTALVFARTETRGFLETVWARADAVLFLAGRLTFCTPAGTAGKGNAGGPSCLVAYGADDARVLAASGLEGALVTDWDRTGAPRLLEVAP